MTIREALERCDFDTIKSLAADAVFEALVSAPSVITHKVRDLMGAELFDNLAATENWDGDFSETETGAQDEPGHDD